MAAIGLPEEQEMARLVRARDWADHPFGPRDQWPGLLRTSVDIVLSTALPMFVAWGEDLRIIYNDGFAGILGSSHPAALGASIPALWAAEWPMVGPLFRRTMSGASICFEDAAFRIRRNGDEEMRYFTFSHTPLRAASAEAPSGLLAICVDTTEQVRDRQRLAWQGVDLEEVFREAPGFIGMTLGPEHRFEFVNDAYREMIGGRDVVGKTVREALPELEAQGFFDLLDRIYATGEQFLGREMPIQLRDEKGELRQRFVNIILKAFRDAQGDVVGLFAEGHDMTGRKADEENIEALEQSLFHASRVAAMSTMATTLAHELNQPLAASSNYLRGTRRLMVSLAGETKVQAEAGLAQAEEQILRAGEIIRRARGMLVNKEPKAETVLLKRLIDRLTRVIRAGDVCPEIEIRTKISSQADTVHADPVQIEQVLLNLIRNACDAMSGEGARDVLIISRAADDPFFVEIEVRDNGHGLLSEPDALFATFGTSTTGGLGVGLPICRTIVEAHRGKMWARNNAGGGASFFFTLPAAEA